MHWHDDLPSVAELQRNLLLLNFLHFADVCYCTKCSCIITVLPSKPIFVRNIYPVFLIANVYYIITQTLYFMSITFKSILSRNLYSRSVIFKLKYCIRLYSWTILVTSIIAHFLFSKSIIAHVYDCGPR